MIHNIIFSPHDNQFAVRPPVAMVEAGISRFCEFRKIPEKDRITGRVQTPRQERIWTHGKEKKKKKIIPAPSQPPL